MESKDRLSAVLVNGDTADESAETFFVNLSNVVNATVTIDLTNGGSPAGNLTFTAANSQTGGSGTAGVITVTGYMIGATSYANLAALNLAHELQQLRAEAETKMRAEAEKKMKDEASSKASAEAEAKVKHHEPLIRNQLVTLFSQQTDASLGTVEAKEALRQEALKQVQAVLAQEEGEPLVEDLLFNNLIIQ